MSDSGRAAGLVYVVFVVVVAAGLVWCGVSWDWPGATFGGGLLLGAVLGVLWLGVVSDRLEGHR